MIHLKGQLQMRFSVTNLSVMEAQSQDCYQLQLQHVHHHLLILDSSFHRTRIKIAKLLQVTRLQLAQLQSRIMIYFLAEIKNLRLIDSLLNPSKPIKCQEPHPRMVQIETIKMHQKLKFGLRNGLTILLNTVLVTIYLMK